MDAFIQENKKIGKYNTYSRLIFLDKPAVALNNATFRIIAEVLHHPVKQ